MKIEELRKGNYFQKDGEFYQIKNWVGVDQISWSDEFNADHFDCSEINPIPLTPEILEGCGFKEYHNNNDTAFYLDNIELYKVDDVYNTEHYVTKTKYLHQLQNLFYSLTGEELTVKLPVTA